LIGSQGKKTNVTASETSLRHYDVQTHRQQDKQIRQIKLHKILLEKLNLEIPKNINLNEQFIVQSVPINVKKAV